MSGKKDKKNPNRESGFVSPSKQQIRASGGNPFAVLQERDDDDVSAGAGASAVVTTSAPSTSSTQTPVTTTPPAGSQPTMAPPDPTAASTVQLNSKVSIPEYSGLKVGTKYIARDGKEATEIYEAEDWIFLVETTFDAAGYDRAHWFKNARVKLVPQTPAFTWIRVTSQFADWDSFRVAFLDQFAPKESAIEKVNLLKSFKQRQKEPVLQYLNRLTMNHSKFLKDLHKEFVTWSTDKDEVRKREAVITRVTKFYARAFFLAGLRDEVLAQVTIEGTEDFDAVVAAAQRTELALQLKEKSAQMSSVSSKAFKDAVQEEVSRQLREASGGVSATQGQGRSPANKDKQRDVANVTCFYCGQKAHYASSCARRKEDRDKGNWRPTIQCPRMTKEQFNGLSSEDKNRGVRLFGRPRTGAQASQNAQGAAGGGSASPPPAGAAAGTSSSFAASPSSPWSSPESREAAFAHFRSSN